MCRRLKHVFVCLNDPGRNPYLTCVISNPGTWGECNRDKKHCCSDWELNFGLNSGLKQRQYICGTIKGNISKFRIISFFILSPFFSRIRLHCAPPPSNVPRFYITQVKGDAERKRNPINLVRKCKHLQKYLL